MRGKLNQQKTKNGVSHYEKWKNGCHFCRISSCTKISNYWPPLKFGSLLFWMSTEIENLHQLLWKNVKMATILDKLIVQQNFQLLTTQRFGLHFSKCWQKLENGISYYDKMEKWPPFCGKSSYSNISNYDPVPKVWVCFTHEWDPKFKWTSLNRTPVMTTRCQ